ncbi:MAG: hypothetical protein RLY71_4154 [Pseudomonadota bacterium]|jgi:hydrogenase expression/formation protein HypC
MCLALPARVVALDADGLMATVDLGGVRKPVSVALVPGVALDDYVIVHVGHAIGLLDRAEAERTLALFAELGNLADVDADAEADADADARTDAAPTTALEAAR